MTNSINYKINNFLIIVSIWLFILFYLLYYDINSFILFLLLPPFFGIMLYSSIKKKNISLSIFLVLIFISQAINPSLFFLSKNKFLESENWEVKDFNFDIVDFFSLYQNMYLLIFLIFFTTLFLNKYFLRKNKSYLENNLSKTSYTNNFEIQSNINTSSKNKYSKYLVLLITFLAIPLCFFMYKNGIGISTIQPKRLPFKLVGLTIYTRMILIPGFIFYFYFKSKRTFFSTLFIFTYALIVGLLSLSKGMLLLAIMPVVIFSYIDKKKTLFLFSIIYGALLYIIVSEFRQFILLTNLGLFDILNTIYNLISDNTAYDSDQNIVLTFLFAFTDRLYGAQYTILASRFELHNNLSFIFDFILSNTESLSKVIAFDIFGIPDQLDVVIGVNIGYLNILLLLAKHNLFFIFLLAFFTSICLTLAEYLAFRYSNRNDLIKIVGYVLCFNMIFFLYDGFIGKFYIIVLLTIIFNMTVNLFTKVKIRV